MLRVNEFQLYELATVVHPLTQISDETKYSDVWLSLMNAKTALQTIFKQRSLEVCFNAASELYGTLREVAPDDFSEAAAKLHTDPAAEEPSLGFVSYSIREAANKFETVLSAELSNSDTYWISPKGTHKTSILMQSARLELPPSVLKEIPEEAAVELDEAGKCLLFDVPTAVGFHLFRATEAVIRKYYEKVIGMSPAKKSRNWGAYIKGLKARGASTKVTGYLDHIREHYRNPVLHPEVTLTPEDAQVLFGVCVSAIVMMASEMTANKGAVLPFTTSGALGTGSP
ncbi:MAG: hypothetical protein ACLQMO_08695 [Acidobacteriaceae bacterium]